MNVTQILISQITVEPNKYLFKRVPSDISSKSVDLKQFRIRQVSKSWIFDHFTS